MGYCILRNTGTHTRHLEMQIINYYKLLCYLIFHAYLLGNNGAQSCGSPTVGIQFDLYIHVFCVLVPCTWMDTSNSLLFENLIDYTFHFSLFNIIAVFKGLIQTSHD